MRLIAAMPRWTVTVICCGWMLAAFVAVGWVTGRRARAAAAEWRAGHPGTDNYLVGVGWVVSGWRLALLIFGPPALLLIARLMVRREH